jgi:hypothetical protein
MENMPFPNGTRSTETKTVEQYERRFREENMTLIRNLCIKEMMNRAKSNDPALWPFKKISSLLLMLSLLIYSAKRF